MAHALERYKKTTGDGPSGTVRLEDWNGVLDTAGALLAQLVQKGADFDAVSDTVLGVLLDRVNGVLSPAYDQVAARAAQVEALYARLNGQGVSAAAIVETADRLFLTADRRAAILSDLRGGVASGGDTLAKLYALASANGAAISAVTTGADPALDTFAEVLARFIVNEGAIAAKAGAADLALKANRDDVPTLDAWISGQIELAELAGKAFGTVNGFFDPFSEPSFLDTANSQNATLQGGLILNQAAEPNTKALLHFNGANGSTTFTDEAGHTFTRSGSAQISTAQTVFVGSAGAFLNNGDLVASTSADYAFGTGDFTYQMRARFPSVGGNRVFFDGRDAAGANGFLIFLNANNNIQINFGGGQVLIGSAVLAANTSYVIQLSRSSGTLRSFVGPASAGSIPIDATSGGSTSNITSTKLSVGGQFDGQNSGLCYLDEFRASNVARNTVAYAPETSEFTAGSTGNLLLRSKAIKLPIGTPTRAMMLAIVQKTAGTLNLNTNLIGSVSRNAGGQFKNLVLGGGATYATDFALYKSPWTDITDQPVSDMLAGKLITNDPALGVAVRDWAVLAAA